MRVNPAPAAVVANRAPPPPRTPLPLSGLGEEPLPTPTYKAAVERWVTPETSEFRSPPESAYKVTRHNKMVSSGLALSATAQNERDSYDPPSVANLFWEQL